MQNSAFGRPRLGLGFVILLGVGLLARQARADDRVGFYRLLLSEERAAVEAIRRLSVDELHAIHVDAMSDRLWSLRSAPPCLSAHMRLSIAVLAYASAIDPTSSRPVRTPLEHAEAGDERWAEYLGLKAACEEALGVAVTGNPIARPSELLSRLLPRLPERETIR